MLYCIKNHRHSTVLMSALAQYECEARSMSVTLEASGARLPAISYRRFSAQSRQGAGGGKGPARLAARGQRYDEPFSASGGRRKMC